MSPLAPDELAMSSGVNSYTASTSARARSAARSRDSWVAAFLMVFAAAAGYVVHPAIGLAVALVLALLAAGDWYLPSELIVPALTALVLLVPADLRIGAGLPVDVSADRVAVAFLLTAWGFGLLGTTAPTPESVRRTTWPLLALLFLAVMSAFANAPGNLVNGTGFGAKALLLLFGYVGVFFLVLALAADWSTVSRTMKVAGGVGGVVAFFAIIERATEMNVIRGALLRLPGVSADSQVQEMLSRGSGVRVEGTGEHAIAFGGAMAMVLPIALALTLRAEDSKQRLLWAAASATIGFALLLSVSRSALIAGAVGFLVLIALWPRQRMALIALAVVGLFAVHMVAPGVLGTFRATLSRSYLQEQERADNPYNRASDYPRVAEMVPEHPVFGIGYNAFEPTTYFYLDNQVLKMLIELGFTGVILMGIFIGGSVLTMGNAARRGPPDRRLVVGALLASTASFATLSVFFDTFSFAQVTYLFFIATALGLRAATLPPPTELASPNVETGPGLRDEREAHG